MRQPTFCSIRQVDYCFSGHYQYLFFSIQSIATVVKLTESLAHPQHAKYIEMVATCKEVDLVIFSCVESTFTGFTMEVFGLGLSGSNTMQLKNRSSSSKCILLKRISLLYQHGF